MNAIVPVSAQSRSLAPSNFQEAMRFADMLSNSTMVPKDFQGKPANILVAVQWGAEVGLGPLQALQNIAIINGRPSIWGDAALALVQGHPAYESHQESIRGEGDAMAGVCRVKRRGSEWHEAVFTVEDAKKAGLWGKSGPWQQYPKRMLQLRARGFAIRDKFADALRGVITAEEAADMPADASRPVVELTATPVIAAQPWPMLDPNMNARNAKDARQWVQWCEAAVKKLENAEAVVAWRNEMQPHFEALEATDAAAVEKVQGAAQDKLDTLADQQGDAE
ncbi:hypothetical protein [Roseomonas haemaphysalidis]|uniref:Recombinase RecT n=1 Tax=Roseomonas haemaphysalidis TaxID=2768162 RepID=A0ABS3KTQ7_9PROT|nr:hypothetical protein [Roseomonas haemaphysalidis]MBO1080864.1 hypothetical protein [Roseomonas haemaphysalidis]